jgi:cell wall-associated NlpC family hydrolase
MTKNAVKIIMLALPTLFLTISCTVVRRAESSTTVVKPSETNAAVVDLRSNIIDNAKTYVGTRYRYASTNPKVGFDCSGFTSFILSKYGYRIAHGSSSQANLGKRVSLEDAQAGDLVFFGRKKRINHVALVVKNNKGNITVVHSTNSRGVVVENINSSDYWRKRVLFARDVIGTETKKNS